MATAPAAVQRTAFPCLLCALVLARGLLYGVLVPPWQAPDEPQHVQTVRLVMELGRVPSPGEALSAGGLHLEVVRSLQEHRFWELRHRRPAPPAVSGEQAATALLAAEEMTPAVSHPPLYYMAVAVLLRPLRSASLETHLYLLRLFSTLLGMLTVWTVYRALCLLSPGDPIRPRAAALWVACLPMWGFMSGAANNDSLANLLAAVTFLALWRGCLQRLSTRGVLALIALPALALLTKRTTLFIIPLVLAAVPFLAHGRAGRRPPGLKLGAALLLVCVGVALILVLDAAAKGQGLHWWSLDWPLSQLFRADHYNATARQAYLLWASLGFASFWANFGWMNVPLDPGWYVVLGWASLAAALGLVRELVGLWGSEAGDRRRASAWLLCLLGVAFILGQTLFAMIGRHRPPQGRYLFPALGPLAACFTWGLFAWVPSRFRSATLKLWTGVWIACDAVAVLGYLLPYYYG